jgi:hypothetical protein
MCTPIRSASFRTGVKAGVTRSGPAAMVTVTLPALWLSRNATRFQPGLMLILTAVITP